MDKYKIIQEIGKGSYGAVYKIQKLEAADPPSYAESSQNNNKL